MRKRRESPRPQSVSVALGQSNEKLSNLSSSEVQRGGAILLVCSLIVALFLHASEDTNALVGNEGSEELIEHFHPEQMMEIVRSHRENAARFREEASRQSDLAQRLMV